MSDKPYLNHSWLHLFAFVNALPPASSSLAKPQTTGLATGGGAHLPVLAAKVSGKVARALELDDRDASARQHPARARGAQGERHTRQSVEQAQ